MATFPLPSLPRLALLAIFLKNVVVISLQHDYLEAVTNAYMMSGVLVTESKGIVVVLLFHVC